MMTNTRLFSRHSRCRISDALTYGGLPMVILENELLRVEVLPHKGAEIWSLLYKPCDISFLLHLPGGLTLPTPYPSTIPSSDGAYIDAYAGGWQEILPSAGGPSTFLGADLGRHGETPLLPWRWEIITDTPENVTARFWVRTQRSPFYLERVMRLDSGQAILYLDETLINESPVEVPFMWGHHPAFGSPFLDGSCLLDVPASQVSVHEDTPDPCHRLSPGSQGSWPIWRREDGTTLDLRPIPPPEAGTADMFYLTDLREGWYALTNRNLGIGFALSWPVEIFPILWVWQEFNGSRNYPWYQRTYTLGLEPFTSYTTRGKGGLAEVIKDGRANYLSPGGQIKASLKAIVYLAPDAEGVAQVNPNGEVNLR